MDRVAFLLVLVGAVAVKACLDTDECECGSVCNNYRCTPGCLVYGQFMAPGSAQRVYGRLCECGTIPDDKGLPIRCMEDEKFTGMPNDVERYTASAMCTGGPIAEAAVATDTITAAPVPVDPTTTAASADATTAAV